MKLKINGVIQKSISNYSHKKNSGEVQRGGLGQRKI